jgi:hypothetical protein
MIMFAIYFYIKYFLPFHTQIGKWSTLVFLNTFSFLNIFYTLFDTLEAMVLGLGTNSSFFGFFIFVIHNLFAIYFFTCSLHAS